MVYTVDVEPFSRGAGSYVDQLVRGILLAGHQEASLARHLTLENAILRRRSTPARELIRRLSIASCCDAGVPRTGRYHTSGSIVCSGSVSDAECRRPGSHSNSKSRCEFWKLSSRFKAAFDRMSTELIEKVDTAQSKIVLSN